jgi:hypothetical protein
MDIVLLSQQLALNQHRTKQYQKPKEYEAEAMHMQHSPECSIECRAQLVKHMQWKLEIEFGSSGKFEPFPTQPPRGDCKTPAQPLYNSWHLNGCTVCHTLGPLLTTVV